MFNTSSYLLQERRAIIRSQILNSLSKEHREAWQEFRKVSHHKNLLDKKTIKILSFLFVIITYLARLKKISFSEAQELFEQNDALGHKKFIELSQNEEVLEILHLFRINNVSWEEI